MICESSSEHLKAALGHNLREGNKETRPRTRACLLVRGVSCLVIMGWALSSKPKPPLGVCVCVCPGGVGPQLGPQLGRERNKLQ